MRSLMVLAALLISGSAFAYPSVGDQATFVGTVTGWDGIVKEATTTVSITGIDPATGQWMLQTDSVVAGEATSEQALQAQDQTFTKELAVQVLTTCAQIGGRPGQMIVPAGVFASCALTQADSQASGTFFIADVPFGYAAYDMNIMGVRIVMKLQSYVDVK